MVLFCLMNNVQQPGFQGGMGRVCIYTCIFCYTFYSYKEITVQRNMQYSLLSIPHSLNSIGAFFDFCSNLASIANLWLKPTNQSSSEVKVG